MQFYSDIRGVGMGLNDRYYQGMAFTSGVSKDGKRI
jgi:hypothetical protein